MIYNVACIVYTNTVTYNSQQYMTLYDWYNEYISDFCGWYKYEILCCNYIAANFCL
jgi:hypothetical protein